MSNQSGKLYPTNYTESDVLDCVTSFKVLTGQDQPESVIVRAEHIKAVSWLEEFGINILTGKIQDGTILLV
jgi:hypothetical protein